jgi:hypothetical protein
MEKTKANRVFVEIWRKKIIQLIREDNIKINLNYIGWECINHVHLSQGREEMWAFLKR